MNVIMISNLSIFSLSALIQFLTCYASVFQYTSLSSWHKTILNNNEHIFCFPDFYPDVWKRNYSPLHNSNFSLSLSLIISFYSAISLSFFLTLLFWFIHSNSFQVMFSFLCIFFFPKMQHAFNFPSFPGDNKSIIIPLLFPQELFHVHF